MYGDYPKRSVDRWIRCHYDYAGWSNHEFIYCERLCLYPAYPHQSNHKSAGVIHSLLEC